MGPVVWWPPKRGARVARFCFTALAEQIQPVGGQYHSGCHLGILHVPLHFMGVYYGGALGSVIRLQEIPRAILFTWLYNRTKGSLLIVLLFHAAVNTTSLFLSRSFEITFFLCILLAIAVVLTDKMWRRLPSSGRSLERS
jgi:hypothetical protein